MSFNKDQAQSQKIAADRLQQTKLDEESAKIESNNDQSLKKQKNYNTARQFDQIQNQQVNPMQSQRSLPPTNQQILNPDKEQWGQQQYNSATTLFGQQQPRSSLEVQDKEYQGSRHKVPGLNARTGSLEVQQDPPNQRTRNRILARFSSDKQSLATNQTCENELMMKEVHPLKDSSFKEVFPFVSRIYFGKDVFKEKATVERTLGASAFNYFGTKDKERRDNHQNQTNKQANSHQFKNEPFRDESRIVTFFKILLNIQSNQDPMQKQLGPGIGSYHQVLLRLIFLFLILFLIHLPVISIFSDNNFYDPSEGFFLQSSLGNMGFSSTQCLSGDLEHKDHVYELQCKSGLIDNLVSWGFQTEFESQDQCQRQNDNFCNQYLEKQKFQKNFEQNCLGLDACSLTNIVAYLSSNATGDSKICKDQQARFFIQYMCKQTDEELASKRDKAEFCIYMAILTGILVMLFVEFAKKMSHKIGLTFDVDTVTPSDYTLQLTMGPSQSQQFDQYYKEKLRENPNSLRSRGLYFHDWLMESPLFRNNEHVKVLIIDPMFDNRELIKLLKLRGYLIQIKDAQRIKEIETKIQTGLEKQYYSRICGAFITFETQQHLENALKIFDKDRSFKIERSREPQNYVWENLGITERDQKIRELIAFIVLFFLLYVAYKIQFEMYRANQSFDKFQEINCKIYEDSLTGSNSEEQQALSQKKAFKAWADYYQADKKKQWVGGSLGCFCDAQYESLGFSAAYQQYRSDGLSEALNSQQSDSTVQQNTICYQYILFNKWSQFFHQLIAIAIIFINMLFYYVIIPLVQNIGFYTKTHEEKLNSILIVLCTILDMLFLPIFIGANLKESDLFKGVLHGQFTDFDADWYTEIGKSIVFTTTIFAFQPIIDFIVEYLTVQFWRFHSRRFVLQCGSEDPNDLRSFIDLKVGPEYPFYYTTSKTTITLLICLLLGGCMPMLYLVGTVAFLLQYVADRLSLAYFYRLPPMYGDLLTLDSLSIMGYIPMFSLSVLFWQYTNRQMFENEIDEIQTDIEVRLSHHYISKLTWSGLSTAQKWLVVTIILMFLCNLLKQFENVFKWLGLKNEKISFVEQDLPNFFDSLKKYNIVDFLHDYDDYSEFGFSFFSGQQVDVLRKELEERERGINLKIMDGSQDNNKTDQMVDKKREIVGDPCYQVFRSIEYYQQFNNATENDKKNVKLLLNLPMISLDLIHKVYLQHNIPSDQEWNDGQQQIKQQYHAQKKGSVSTVTNRMSWRKRSGISLSTQDSKSPRVGSFRSQQFQQFQ